MTLELLDETQLRQADEAGDAAAARQLGVLLEERGDLDGAEAAYERAVGRGDVAALGKLAILIDIHRDDPAAAEAAYRRADDAGSVDGAGNLGRILKERGDLRRAEAAFKRCVERGSVRALADYAGLLSMREDADKKEIVATVRRLCPIADRFNEAIENEGNAVLEYAAPVMVFEGMLERCAPAAIEAGLRSADADGSAAGAFNLGMRLRSRGDLQAASEASARAGERGHAMGWVNAGVALSELGDLSGAEAAARKAEEAGEVKGTGLLGSVLDQRGDRDGALEAYRRADAAGDGPSSFNLGIELRDRGRLEEAEEAFAHAEESEFPNSAGARNAVRAELGLPPAKRSRGQDENAWQWAAKLDRLGDVPGAVAAYDEAMKSGEEPEEPLAILRQAELLEGRGEAAAAEQAFTRIADAADPAIRAGAWRGIAHFRIARGEAEAGLEGLRKVVETEDEDETPRALRNIGVLLEDELDDLEGARAAYREAIDHDHSRHSPGARVNLAQILDRDGDHAGAESLFREAIESGHSAEAPRARVLLGLMLEEQGDGARALELFESAMDGGDDEWAPRAALNAGAIYSMQHGENGRAADAFRRAEHSGDAKQSLTASFLRGNAERELGNEEGALTAFLRVAEEASAGVVDMLRCGAAKQAGIILISRQDYESARPLLTAAAEAEDPVERARGLLLLGSCERSLGHRDAAVAAFRQAESIPGAPDDVRRLALKGLDEL